MGDGYDTKSAIDALWTKLAKRTPLDLVVGIQENMTTMETLYANDFADGAVFGGTVDDVKKLTKQCEVMLTIFEGRQQSGGVEGVSVITKYIGNKLEEIKGEYSNYWDDDEKIAFLAFSNPPGVSP